MRSLWLTLLLLIPIREIGAQTRNLDIYWIDVEGGAATLMVSPSGKSLLIDAGWEVDGRDGNAPPMWLVKPA
jgi:competence protein ComEC